MIVIVKLKRYDSVLENPIFQRIRRFHFERIHRTSSIKTKIALRSADSSAGYDRGRIRGEEPA